MLLDALRTDKKLTEWLKPLEESEDAAAVEARLPGPDELPDALVDLAVPYEDVNDLVALRRALTDDEKTTRLLERCVGGLARDMGKIGKGLRLPPFPLESGPLGRYFPVYVFVAALPYVRAYHHERGIPDDVSRRNLADHGRGLVLHRRRYGVGGLVAPTWFSALPRRVVPAGAAAVPASAARRAGRRGARGRGTATAARGPVPRPAHS